MDKFSSRQEDFWFTLLRKGDAGSMWHPHLELLYVLEGTGRVCYDGSGDVYQVQEEDIFAVNSFQICDVDLDDGALVLSLSLSSDFIEAMSPETLNCRFGCRSFLFSGDRQQAFLRLRSDLADAFQVQYKNEMRHSLYIRSRVAAVLEDLVRCFLEEAPAISSEGGYEGIRMAAEYIQKHFRENITLEELAEHVCLSRTYLSHSFSKNLGLSFTVYLTQVRVAHAVRQMHGAGTLTEIAYESGFPNVNAMIRAFRQYRNMTPGEYRKLLKGAEVQERGGEEKASEQQANPDQDAFTSLLKYAGGWQEADAPKEVLAEIRIDLRGRRQRLPQHWRRVMTAGYARDMLDGNVQAELAMLQKAVGFEYIRVKGFLDDDMCLLRRVLNGSVVTNYTYVDEVVDSILSVGAKPMLELAHMPRLLAKNPFSLAMRPAVISAPRDYREWSQFVQELVEHLVQRYGRQKVRQWIFTPWLSPDYVDYNMITLEEYEAAYLAAYQGIKKVDGDFLVGGPGSGDSRKYLRWFLQMCKRNQCMPDIITFRSFASVQPEEEESGLKLIGNNESFSYAVSQDEDFLYHTVEAIKDILLGEGVEGRPLVLEEWTNNIWQRDLCNDTCFKSAYLFKNILENNGHLNGLGYFSLDDRLDEVSPARELFHGGFGLFAKNRLPKSAYRALELLGRMGDRLVQKGSGYFVAQGEEGLQIYLYHYTHYDMLYRYRHTANMSATDRYRVFNPKPAVAFHLQLNNMPPGRYRIRRYGITREGGSSYDAWVRMGAPDPAGAEEREAMERLSYPEYKIEIADLGEEEPLRIKAALNPLEVCLITVIRE